MNTNNEQTKVDTVEPSTPQQPIRKQQQNFSLSSEFQETPTPSISMDDCSHSTFFADATLDIEEAHDIADMTPKMDGDDHDNSTHNKNKRRILSLQEKTIELPCLDESNDKTEGDTNNRPSSMVGMNINSKNSAPATVTDVTNRNKTPITRAMKNVTSNSVLNNQQDTFSSNHTNLPTYRPRAPRYPRDIPWAIALLIFIPLSFIIPFVQLPKYDVPKNPSTNIGNWAHSLSNRKTLLFNTTLTLLTSIFLLGRTLYLSTGGGDGDDARYKASTLLLVSSAFTWIPFGILAIQVYWLEAHDDDGDGELEGGSILGFVMVGLIFVMVYELFIFSYKIYDSSSTTSSNSASRSNLGNSLTMVVVGNSPLWNGRRTAFFRELASMSLDILSRSLRCQSFYRVVCALVFVQFMLVWVWHNALIRILCFAASTSNTNMDTNVGENKSTTGMVLFWRGCLITICFGGWWVCSFVRRILGLIASGGITAWFAQQSLLLEEMERMKENLEAPLSRSVGQESRNEGASIVRTKTANLTMPEAYRVDASAYSSALEFDEGIDDDYDYEDDEELYGGGGGGSRHGDSFLDASNRRGVGSNQHSGRSGSGGKEWTGGGSGGASTVKAFLISSLTVSLGSVAKCALVGGWAQLVWRMSHMLESAVLTLSTRLFLRQRRSGFQGMKIENQEGMSNEGSNDEGLWERIVELCKKVNVVEKKFVRNNSELALCHVAAYFKSYRRAANDVMALVDASGVESILIEDISSHMCSSISKLITGILTIFGAIILLYQKSGKVSDVVVCETMIISYIMCYTILFTIMEPLRASITAVYVCFAQHPQSLSQAFPLVFHRLSRISEDNNVVV